MIQTNYADRGTPAFRVLTDAQCQTIYLAALDCLDQIGVEVANGEARELLRAAGARAAGTRVKLPPHLVKDALASTPPAFTVWGRDTGREMRVAPDRVHFGPGLTNTYFIDPDTGERRSARRGDPGLTARVADALPGIDYVMGLALISDVRADLASVYEFAELLANTGKPILAWAHKPANVAAMVRMAAAVAGSEQALAERPLFALFSTYPSPLRHTDEDLANLLTAAAHGIPVVYLGGPTVGLESPVTGAGALVLHLANALQRADDRATAPARRGHGHRLGARCDGYADAAPRVRLSGDEPLQRGRGRCRALSAPAVHGHGRQRRRASCSTHRPAWKRPSRCSWPL